MYIRLKVKQGDGKDLDDNADVSTTNLFLHSLFELVEVYIGSTLVSSKTNYHYCSYLLTHLSYNSEFKDNILRNALYISETKLDKLTTENPGYKARKDYIKSSKSVELIGPIYDDILCQDRYILPKVDVRIKLKRAPAKFSLLAPLALPDFKIEFEEVVYMVKRHVVSPQVIQLHERQLSSSKALYPYTLNQIKTLSIPQNSVNAVFENLFPSSKLPQVLLIGFVDAHGYNAKITKNPFCFEHFDLVNINLSIDQVSYEYRNLNLKFDSKYLLAFQSFLTGLNLENRSVGLDRDNYVDGNVFYAFQLLGYEGSDTFEDKTGNIKLELTFGSAVTKQIIGICLAQTKSLMTIDKNLNVELQNQGVL